MPTRLAGPLCRDTRCDWAPLEDLSGEAALGTASLRVDAALLDGWPVVREAAARSFGSAAFGDRGGIPSRQGWLSLLSERGLIWQLLETKKTSFSTCKVGIQPPDGISIRALGVPMGNKLDEKTGGSNATASSDRKSVV